MFTHFSGYSFCEVWELTKTPGLRIKKQTFDTGAMRSHFSHDLMSTDRKDSDFRRRLWIVITFEMPCLHG